MPKIGYKAPSEPKPTLADRDKIASETLAAKYDALNEQFTLAETRLKTLKPLRTVWVSYDEECLEGGVSCWDLLGLHKVDGKWRLVHATDNETNDDGSSPHDIKPIVECRAEVRVRAAKEVRRLHEEIVKQKETRIPEVEEAIAELVSYCIET